MAVKKEVQKVWLHHATEDSKVVVVNSKEYKDMLKDGFRKTMIEVLKDRELLEDAKADETEGLVPVSDLSNAELSNLYNECDNELVKRGLLESQSEDETSKKGK